MITPTPAAPNRFGEFLAFPGALGHRAKGWQIFQNGFAKFGFQPASFGVTRPAKMRGEKSKPGKLGWWFHTCFFFRLSTWGDDPIQFHNGW